jgi:glycosyltransferase involved in cell wall biosynthesis
MDNPLVSAIVPVYNGQRYLAAAIESIFAQDYRPVEVIVVDDGSSDGTAAVAQAFPIRYFHQKNQGPAVARNTGIAAATGEFIAFLDADDVWTPSKLRVQVDYLLNHPAIGYTCGRLQNFYEPGIQLPEKLPTDLREDAEIALSPCTLLARRSVFDQVGLFDPKYQVGEDTDWFVRAKDAGIARALLPDLLLRRRVHDNNLSYAQPAIRAKIQMQILKASIDRQRGRAGQAGVHSATDGKEASHGG